MKMLEEQKELLDWARPIIYPTGATDRSVLNQLVDELVKAVREDCAKVALSQVWNGEPYDNMTKNMAAEDIAAAIRKRR